jgi:hypothetical protein
MTFGNSRQGSAEAATAQDLVNEPHLADPRASAVSKFSSAG